ALVRFHRSRRGQWALAVGSCAVVIVLALLAVRHFATTSWPLSGGHPALLVAAGVLLLIAQAFKAYGWGRLFAVEERPKPLALAARPLAEPTHDLAAARVASVGSRFHLLDRPGHRALPDPGCARDRLLVPTRARLSLCRRGRRRAADRSGRRRYANRRGRRGPPRLGRRSLSGNQRRRFRRGPRRPVWIRDPSLRHCLPHRPATHAGLGAPD